MVRLVYLSEANAEANVVIHLWIIKWIIKWVIKLLLSIVINFGSANGNSMASTEKASAEMAIILKAVSLQFRIDIAPHDLRFLTDE